MHELELRPVRPDEVDAHVTATSDAFYSDLHPDVLALWAGATEPERTLDFFAGDTIVATSGLLTRELTVPGAVVPMAGVTAVGVRADHRRRGLLARMMRGHLEAIRDRGTESVAALWASEARIYGRFGFGIAAREIDLTVHSPRATLRAPGDARPRMAEPRDVLDELAAIHDAVRRGRPGMLARSRRQWESRTADPEVRREGRGRLRAALVDDGYALFGVRTAATDGESDATAEVLELVASTPRAHGALWRFLLGLDLTHRVRWHGAPADEPIVHALEDARAARLELGDSLWVRLVDVAGALGARTYAAPVDVVLDVGDEVCPHNAGRVRLAGDRTGATCEPTSDAPDLSLTATELSAAYLGGTSLAVLAAAGRVTEHTRGALAAADVAFRGDREPWCPEIF